MFTRVSACMVARSPKVTRYTRVLQQICYLLHRSGCFRPSDRLAGRDSHPLEIADFSRRTGFLGVPSRVLLDGTAEGAKGAADKKPRQNRGLDGAEWAASSRRSVV